MELLYFSLRAKVLDKKEVKDPSPGSLQLLRKIPPELWERCEKLRINPATRENPFVIDYHEALSPHFLALLLQLKCEWLKFSDGYILHILEYIAELLEYDMRQGSVEYSPEGILKTSKFLRELMAAFTIHNYEDSYLEALDFFYLILTVETGPLKDLSHLKSYREILWEGSHHKISHLSTAALLFNALCTTKVTFHKIDLSDCDCTPPEAVHLILAWREPGQDAFSPILYKKYSPGGLLTRYITAFKLLPDLEQRVVSHELGVHLISPLCRIIENYLSEVCSRDLWDHPMSEVGIIFPPHIKTEPEKYRYYYDNIGHYVYVIDKNRFFIDPRTQLHQKTDGELLKLAKGAITSWKNRPDLYAQAASMLLKDNKQESLK